jgi:hypothetical protein
MDVIHGYETTLPYTARTFLYLGYELIERSAQIAAQEAVPMVSLDVFSYGWYLSWPTLEEFEGSGEDAF